MGEAAVRYPTLDEAIAAYWEQTAAERSAENDAEIKRRIRLAKWANERGAATQAAIIRACSQDVAVFFDDWVWSQDPRLIAMGMDGRTPFRLRPKQRECLRELTAAEEAQESLMIEKSRDEGGSYLVLGFFLHHWLFRDGFKAAVGSRKQELVDKLGDPDSLFEKLRRMLYALPTWMLPQGYSRKDHDNFLRLVNPANGSTITGEAGDNMGRGGRNAAYMVDEWAHIERADSVNAAISQNSNFRIKVLTPSGPGTVAYRERFSGRMRVFTLHWRDNPVKNQPVEVLHGGEVVTVYPWYEIQKRDPSMTPAILAQEVDINWNASVEDAVIPAEWVSAAVGLALADGSVNRSGLDVSEDGADKTMYANRRGGRVAKIKELRGTPAQKSRSAEDEARADGCQSLYYDRLGVGSAITATLADKSGLPFRVVGIANNDDPDTRRFEDQPETPANERFDRWSDEQWWALRLRFMRTYQRVSEGVAVPDEDCISIPNDAGLIAELSQPTWTLNSAGKIKVSKRGRGGQSPDKAEAVLYAFAEPRELFFHPGQLLPI